MSGAASHTVAPTTPSVADDGDALGPAPQRCTRHPQRETLVSCGRCGRPFCPECLIHTPAGQRCYECAGVRRQAAQVSAASALAKVFAIVVVGALIGSLFGLMGLLVAGLAGNMAGQALGPHVNRHTRRTMYPIAIVLLLAGVALGFLLPALFSAASAGRLSVPLIEALVARVVGNVMFWVFASIMAAVGYQRVR